MREFMEKFFAASTYGMLERFASLPDAEMEKHGNYVLVPGKRENAVLLVAHADTSYNTPCYSVEWTGNIAKAAGSNRRPDGTFVGGSFNLGADDRVGCAMLWSFRNSGHSLLITNGEEKGGVGAKVAAREIGEWLGKYHQFAVEIDRRGDQGMVFYDVATEAFRKFMAQQAPGWSVEQGTFTDIRAICPAAGICGVNLTAGYLNEHRTEETFFLDAWLRTRTLLGKILRQDNLPRFELPKAPLAQQWDGRGGNYGHREWRNESNNSGKNEPAAAKPTTSGTSTVPGTDEKKAAIGYIVERCGTTHPVSSGQSADGAAATAGLGARPAVVVVEESSLERVTYDLGSDAYKKVQREVRIGTAKIVDILLWEDAGGVFTLFNRQKKYGELTQNEMGTVVLIDWEGRVLWQELTERDNSAPVGAV